MINRFGRRQLTESSPQHEPFELPPLESTPTYQPPSGAEVSRGKVGRVGMQTLVSIHREVLDRVDPTEAARMPAPELMVRVERLISQIADERNLSLNQTEQRALAADIVDEIGRASCRERV